MSLTKDQLDKIISMAQAYGVTRLILFGSTAEAEGRDIDLACDGLPGWKLYEFAARLEEILLKSLDVVPLTPASRFTRHIENRGKVLL